MRLVESAHPPGLVGLSCGELARFTEFHAAFETLMAPVGSDVKYGIGYDTAANSNGIIRQMEPWHEWVTIWDDDHWFPADLLLSQLEHQVDLLVPLYYQRKPPFWPVLYRERHADGSCTPFTHEELQGRAGLIADPVSAGKGGVFIRRAVLDALAGGPCGCPATPEADRRLGKDRPHERGCLWRTHEWFYKDGAVGEDHTFFRDCLKAGIALHCDLDRPIDHFSTFRIRPYRDPATGKWLVEVDLYNSVRITVDVTHAAQRPAPTQEG